MELNELIMLAAASIYPLHVNKGMAYREAKIHAVEDAIQLWKEVRKADDEGRF